ncbi:flagellar protein FliT [Paeniclostridium hominis]|uniref:flagellar protein FliT n=1 Tax=Paeniclostridium hominis TaxID=2764329 RepID=UPI0022DF987C|nr:flagellar protein FliT [Paeniclostridium hominis]
MEVVTKKYKQISLDIIDKLENNNTYDIDELLNERQKILDNVSDRKLFKQMLVKDGMLEIDEKIHSLIKENIIKVKMEIVEHKKSKQANNSYINYNKENLNIFNKKV